MNPRVTPRERGLLKGAIRRVFARSKLRNEVLEAAVVSHSDVKRPRVTKWVKCAVCTLPVAKYQAAVDHIEPVVKVGSSFEEQGLDKTVDRMWCDKALLQVICETCHDDKTKLERLERKKLKGKSKK